MVPERALEYVFFFGLLGVAGYLVWEIIAPFISALAFAAIIATICYPLYEWVYARLPGGNATIASLATTALVVLIVVIPLTIIGSLVLREAVSIYSLFNTTANGAQFSLTSAIHDIEVAVEEIVPGLQLNIVSYLQQIAEFVASNITTIFANTASTVFLFFIALMGAFYFFRDGKRFTKYLIEISPLPDTEDTVILERLARSVRSVALGAVLVAIVQGTLTAIGLSIFGFERAILWGTIAAIGALVPAVGTSIVFVPAVVYLIVIGDYFTALGVTLWASLAVGLIDNILGPYLISRGGTLHPFVILLSVLGGITAFGPIGFVVGPVIFSFFKVMLELYMTHIATRSPAQEEAV